jgi:hypothetical protein
LSTQSTFIAQVDNTAPHIELPDEWNIWDTVTFDAWDHDSGLASAEISISDPQGRWPKRSLHFLPGQLPVGLQWDRRFGDGTIALMGDYDVLASASDKLGNERHSHATIHISLAGSIFPAPGTATPLPSPRPSATPTQTELPETPTPTESTNSQSALFGTAQPVAQYTPTATNTPTAHAAPVQTDILTLIQSFFSPPPATSETTSDFASGSGDGLLKGPALFALSKTDPAGLGNDLATGSAATAAIAAFAVLIEKRKREEEARAAAAAAQSRATSAERHMDAGERQAHELHD